MEEQPYSGKPTINPSDHLANERTFLAWVRTSIALMGFGFVVVKFSLFIKQLSIVFPEWEGIGKRIEEAYVKAGGETLRKAVMETKVKDSTTYLTQIHHRQTPMRIMYNQSDAAPVWYSEAYYQQMIGHPIELIEIPSTENITATYVAGQMKNAPHIQAAKDFVDFLVSEKAKAIYRKYGFTTDK